MEKIQKLELTHLNEAGLLEERKRMETEIGLLVSEIDKIDEILGEGEDSSPISNESKFIIAKLAHFISLTVGGIGVVHSSGNFVKLMGNVNELSTYGIYDKQSMKVALMKIAIGAVFSVAGFISVHVFRKLTDKIELKMNAIKGIKKSRALKEKEED